MAAEVGSQIRVLGIYGGEDCNRRRRNRDRISVNESSSGGDSTGLITRDFLGGSKSSSSRVEAQELDLDLEVPSGFEKRLDLKSGKVYLHRCNSPNSSVSSSTQNDPTNLTVPALQDLNFPPSSSEPPFAFFEEPSMELKLFPSPASPSPPSNYQCICTLDNVKSALERAERQSTNKQSPFYARSKSPSLSASPSNRSTSIKETEEYDVEKPILSSPVSLFAAACPSCLLYVLISRSNPKCPRCHSIVPLPTAIAKKPRLDLNISV